jgi:hypothetical protein
MSDTTNLDLEVNRRPSFEPLTPELTMSFCSITPMAGLDRHANFYAIAKTMPIVTAVACFLSTQNMGS